MSTIRYFSGAREPSSNNPAIALKKLEIQKRGKLPSNVRFKYILKKKMEAKMGINTDPTSQKREFEKLLEGGLDMAGGSSVHKLTGRKPSARAQHALREKALKKAHRAERDMRKMVVVQRQSFHNGHITNKGKIYDVAGNQVGSINTKNGRMTTMNGWNFGKYKPRNVGTNMAIQNAINLHSPYFINLRKMQQMQQGDMAQEVVNVYGHTAASSPLYGGAGGQAERNAYGSDPTGPRQNIGMTAWGAMSNNVMGVFSDNAWGTVSDNAWGTASTDVWGGISTGNLWGSVSTGSAWGSGGGGSARSLWGSHGPKVWGTGNGMNYLQRIGNYVAGMLGFKTGGKFSKAEKKAMFAKRVASKTAVVVRPSARR